MISLVFMVEVWLALCTIPPHFPTPEKEASPDFEAVARGFNGLAAFGARALGWQKYVAWGRHLALR